ncbi:MAG TPA: hypothetical protein VNS57_12770 [Steroidobacteraceae bacterium]|nr:hypothetical protein [Steroidobacteraceae bacterium]
MLSFRSMLLAVLPLLVGALPAAAESLPELLKPVDPAVEAELMAKTNFDFRQQRYTAKRFRIVDIDWALLEQEGARFTITPFEDPELADLAITVRTKTTDLDPIQDERRQWYGEIEDSAGWGYKLDGEPIWISNQEFSLWIISGPQQVSPKAARKVAAETGGEVIAFGPRPVASGAPDAPGVITKLDLRTLYGMWLAARGVQIQIEPITDDPRYHLVYWVDRDKVPHGGGGPDEERKYREQKQFREQLQREREAAAANP